MARKKVTRRSKKKYILAGAGLVAGAGVIYSSYKRKSYLNNHIKGLDIYFSSKIKNIQFKLSNFSSYYEGPWNDRKKERIAEYVENIPDDSSIIPNICRIYNENMVKNYFNDCRKFKEYVPYDIQKRTNDIISTLYVDIINSYGNRSCNP